MNEKKWTQDTMGLPIVSQDDLVSYFEEGCKPAARFRIGVEHEKLLFVDKTLARVAYGDIQQLLKRLETKGWGPQRDPYETADAIYPLVRDGASVSLEPSGQLELSGAPLETVGACALELDRHLDELQPMLRDLGLIMVGMGCDPITPRKDRPLMHKTRYDIMRAYMPTVGSKGLDMMSASCSIQVNLDFSSEQDMARKMRVGMMLQPLIMAIFADAPYFEGVRTPYQSARLDIWQNTDAARADFPNSFLSPNFTFEEYVAYALDVPMYFVKRNGYINVAGQSFKSFLEGKLQGVEGRPLRSDWLDHLSTLFPPIRLRQYLEMRGTDGGRRPQILALAAFWTGIFYDETSLGLVEDLIAPWGVGDVKQAYRDCARGGLDTLIQGQSVLELARLVTPIARAGLVRRGTGEETYLAFIEQVLTDGRNSAMETLNRFSLDVLDDQAGRLLIESRAF